MTSVDNNLEHNFESLVRGSVKPIHFVIVRDIHNFIDKQNLSSLCELQDYIKRYISKKFKLTPRKDLLAQAYNILIDNKELLHRNLLDRYFIKVPTRSHSGVLVVTIVLRPDKFSCGFDCKYCPNETVRNGATVDMPRSYLSSEPAVMRAMKYDFDIVQQFTARLDMLHLNGHTIDKIEVIVLGGTFSNYPVDYQFEMATDIFYAANTYMTEKRKKFSLTIEQSINETSDVKIIGISLETRPDQINVHELMKYRQLGCTRIQIGVQHTNNRILSIVNRKHTVECSIKAIKLIKDFGFKVDIHIMPDLPGASIELDREMLVKIFTSDDFQADYMKIYPCLDVAFTEIRKWKESGVWKPYSETNMDGLIDLIIYAKTQLVTKHVRLNRIQRDFPESHKNNQMIGYVSENHKSNLRQLIDNKMQKENKKCLCIRCRELKCNLYAHKDVHLHVESYNASDGVEKFISFDDIKSNYLIGFCRLRFLHKKNSSTHHIKSLRNTALIRELHVYGAIRSTSELKHSRNSGQHVGYGKLLIKQAEVIAYITGYNRIAVISGVGVRKYYEKLGYFYKDTYMIKNLTIFNILHNLYTLVKYSLVKFFMTNIY